MPSQTESSSIDAKQKRNEEINNWFLFFKLKFDKEFPKEPLTFIDNHINVISDAYWDVLDNHIRKYIESSDPLKKSEPLVHHSKIISIMEFVIMDKLPITNGSNKGRCALNAHFALFVAKNIILSWNTLKLKEIVIEPFEEEHLTFLQLWEGDYFPFFVVADSWFLYESLVLYYQKNFIYRIISSGKIKLINIPTYNN